jgi:predicted nucleic acid-binding protein
VKDGWLQRVAVDNRVAVDALLGELDLGEAETIVLARQLNVKRVLLDDRAARTKAGLMGLAVTGTVGALLLARQAGVEIDLKEDLNLLIQHNFRFSHSLYQKLTAR